MRSAITGLGVMYMCVLIFVICATIQMNANIAVQVSEAANEAAYLSMLSLTERDEISTDEQLEEEFVKNANLILENQDIHHAYDDSKEYSYYPYDKKD